MIKQNKISLTKTDSTAEKGKPSVIPWRGSDGVKVDFIRSQSIRAAVKEMLKVSKSLDVVKFGIIGNQNSGKSTQLLTIGHLIHKMANIPFAVKIFDKYALLNLQETLKTLTPTNYFIGFDDTSFLGAQANKKQLDVVKQVTTEIRHLPGGQDVKIFLGMNYHYTLGVDKYLRQGEFKFFTSVGSSEIDNMEKIVGINNMDLVRDFKKMYTRMLVSEKFTFMLGEKPFVYSNRNPFIPMLFWNEDSLRVVVSPTREWIDSICTVCANAVDSGVIGEIDEVRYVKESRDAYGKGAFDSALRVVLAGNGINTYGASVERARRGIVRDLAKKITNLEKLAIAAGLEPTKTQNHTKPVPVMQEPSR